MADGVLGQERGVGLFEDVCGMDLHRWCFLVAFPDEVMVSIRLWFLRTCSCHSLFLFALSVHLRS